MRERREVHAKLFRTCSDQAGADLALFPNRCPTNMDCQSIAAIISFVISRNGTKSECNQ